MRGSRGEPEEVRTRSYVHSFASSMQVGVQNTYVVDRSDITHVDGPTGGALKCIADEPASHRSCGRGCSNNHIRMIRRYAAGAYVDGPTSGMRMNPMRRCGSAAMARVGRAGFLEVGDSPLETGGEPGDPVFRGSPVWMGT